MKKQTKKMIVVLFVVFAMFGSTFAYVILGNPSKIITEQQGPSLPTVFVVDGMLNETLKQSYISMGYTIGTFYYIQGCCATTHELLQSLPGQLEYQLVIEKIPSNETKFDAVSLRADASTNQTNSTEILKILCKVLMMPPPDCALI